MKPLFIISPKEIADTSSLTLLLSIHQEEIRFALLNEESKLFSYVSYQFENDDWLFFNDCWNKILNHHSYLSFPYKKVITEFAFNETIVSPGEIQIPEPESLLQHAFGKNSGAFLKNDFLPKKNLNIFYQIPQRIYNTINQQYSFDKEVHIFSNIINTVMLLPEENVCWVVFGNRHFTICLKQSNQLKIAQDYTFLSPNDVVYYMLALCEEFNINRSQQKIIANGMINNESALFNELIKYFNEINFAETPAGFFAEEFLQDHSNHLFYPVYQSFLCASSADL